MASYKKLKSGWTFRISHKQDGEYTIINSNEKFRTKKEAEIAAGELKKRLEDGFLPDAHEVTLHQYMTKWFAAYHAGKHSTKTEKAYELSLAFVKDNFKSTPMAKITRAQYQIAMNEYGKTHSIETSRKRHKHIRSCAKDAIADGHISRDFTHNILLSGNDEKKEKRIKYLSKADLNKLISEVKSDLRFRYISRFLILVGAKTGLRFGELSALEWSDVDFENATISVNKSYDPAYRETSSGKTASSTRIIKMDDDTSSTLKELRKLQREHLMKIGEPKRTPPVFVNTSLERISSNAVNKTLKSLCERCGITPVTFHALRHTHASILIHEGVHLKYVSQRLGHSSVTITLEIYAHIIDEMEQAQSEAVMKALSDLN